MNLLYACLLPLRHMILAGFLLASTFCRADAPMVITLLSPESVSDPREVYSAQVINLAMEKTRKEYGDFKINFTEVQMGSARGLVETKGDYYPNLLVFTTFQNPFLDDGLDYVRFPADFGITGYRICFVSPQAKEAVAKATSVAQLRAFSIGQRLGWPDVTVLRHNHFKVIEAQTFEFLFRMLTGDRFDLLCRGINELETDLKNRADIPGLDYDRSMAIAYPLPRFFITDKRNTKAIERVSKGLHIAYRDGSLHALWQKQYASALRFANLKQRKIFHLQTPNIDRIDFDYKRYFFDPLK